MPVYVYRCTGCNDLVEIKHKVKEKPIVICGLCGHECRKTITSVPTHYKGGGFAKTDDPRRK